MTTTSARTGRTPEPTSTPPAPGPETSFTAPPKLRRRPALMVGGIAASCLGGLLAAWAWTSTTHTEDVLAARVTIHRGDLIIGSDLERVRISGDPALDPLPASAYDSIIGQRAALDVAAGGLLTAASTSTQPLPPPGQSVVGISLTGAQLPAVPLLGGDRVRVVATPGQNGTPAKTVVSTAAQVVDTSTDEASGNTVVDVLVPANQAASLAALAATGNVALVLDAEPSTGAGTASSAAGSGGR